MSLSLSKLTLKYAWNCAKIDNFSGMIDKWSLGHVFLLFAVGCTQLIVLRKLFDAKPTSHKLTARAWQFGQYKNEINDFWKEKKTATANQRLSVGCIFGREPSICSAIVEIEPLLLVTNTFCISCQPTTKAAFTSNFKLNLLNKQVSEIKFSKKVVLWSILKAKLLYFKIMCTCSFSWKSKLQCVITTAQLFKKQVRSSVFLTFLYFPGLFAGSKYLLIGPLQ